jgi:hypothetical protein
MAFVRKHFKILYYLLSTIITISFFISIHYFNMFDANKDMHFFSDYYESLGSHDKSIWYQQLSIYYQNFVIFTLVLIYVLFSFQFMRFAQDFSNYPSIMADYRRLSLIKNSCFSIMLCLFLILMNLQIPFMSYKRFGYFFSRYFITIYAPGLLIHHIGNKKSHHVKERMNVIKDSKFTKEDEIEYRELNQHRLTFFKRVIPLLFLINLVLISPIIYQFFDYHSGNNYPKQLVLSPTIQIDDENICSTWEVGLGCRSYAYRDLIKQYRPVEIEVKLSKFQLESLEQANYKVQVIFDTLFSDNVYTENPQMTEYYDYYYFKINFNEVINWEEVEFDFITVRLVDTETNKLVENIYEDADFTITMEYYVK